MPYFSAYMRMISIAVSRTMTCDFEIVVMMVWGSLFNDLYRIEVDEYRVAVQHCKFQHICHHAARIFFAGMGGPFPVSLWKGGRQGVYPCRPFPLLIKQSVGYLFRLTSSSSIWSAVVMILELAWNPLWATIICVNSFARSTLDISRE